MIGPISLEHGLLRLEPMLQEHGLALADAAADGELWNLEYTSVPRPDGVACYIDKALAAQRAGLEVPYVIRQRASGRIVGTTRYLHIEEAHKRLEIGSTWIARSCQGSYVNPVAKLLLLDHAFAALGMNRVEFLTHTRNAQSRAALTKIGATQEGILRHHKVLPDGSLRDSVVFSIIAPEWPEVRQRLCARIAAAD
jgi:N-acetyltransferase